MKSVGQMPASTSPRRCSTGHGSSMRSSELNATAMIARDGLATSDPREGNAMIRIEFRTRLNPDQTPTAPDPADEAAWSETAAEHSLRGYDERDDLDGDRPNR